jgi:hypothetical protein
MIQERARALSSGFRVYENGHRAAQMYRQAAKAYRERGGFSDAYRAAQCDDAALRCDSLENSGGV